MQSTGSVELDVVSLDTVVAADPTGLGCFSVSRKLDQLCSRCVMEPALTGAAMARAKAATPIDLIICLFGKVFVFFLLFPFFAVSTPNETGLM